MKPIQYPLGISPEKISELHAWYCERTRMDYRLDRRIESSWSALLASRSIDEIKMVAGYLSWRVDREKRLPGCLKLNSDNFFNQIKFADDLAEARRIKSRIKPKPTPEQQAMRELRPGAVPTTPTAEPQPINEVTRRFMVELEERKARRAK